MIRVPLAKTSLSFRFGLAVALLTVLALANILAAIFIIQNADAYASAVNIAGSLRMQSYRISTQILKLENQPRGAQIQDIGNTVPTHQLSLETNDFIARLRNQQLLNVPEMDKPSDVQDAYRLFESEWNTTMLPALVKLGQLNAGTPQFSQTSAIYLHQVNGFVEHIDHYVRALQKASENRIRLLGLIALFCVFCIVGVAYTVIYLLNATVIIPLNELVEVADKFRQGNLKARSSNTSQDELGVLGQVYNQMAESISQQYAQLENKVHQKTRELMRINQTLEFLYQTSKKLMTSPGNTTISSILIELKKITGVEHAMLCFKAGNGAHSLYDWLCCCGKNSGQQFPCSDPDFHRQIQADSNSLAPAVTYPLIEGHNYFGFIYVEPYHGQTLDQWQYQLIQNVGDQLAVTYSLQHQDAQDHLVMLFEERATIARELHDSLAQSLTYLKMQNTRLKTLLQRDAEESVILNVSADMEQGLNAAYRNLRELLNTFRLKIKEASLEAALNATVEEFTALTDIPVELEYDLQHIQLSPNEIIHVLQIVREAVSNAVKHAQASSIRITGQHTGNGEVSFSVVDDGKGFPEPLSTPYHYGLAIMQERASSLGGQLSILPGPEGGTRVLLEFKPHPSVTQRKGPIKHE